MNFISDKEISEGAIASREKKFISIEDYQTFEDGVRFAESKTDALIELSIECALSKVSDGKSIEEIKDYFINYMDEIKDL
jgi:geranylgeranyl pyrophosphate synthase